MKFFLNLVSVLFVFLLFQQSVQATNFVRYDEVQLQKIKQSLKTGKAHEVTLNAYKDLINKADVLLTKKPPSVIDKNFFPPSKNKQDYLSISRYWWPDPSKEDGLPWIRNDGITNPSTQTDDVDRNRLGLMARMASTLSLAYYFSDDEKYARKAASVLKVWFIDTATRMNPHLTYAQSVPGNPKGRRSGILDGRIIPSVVPDAIQMISKSAYWSDVNTTQVNGWLQVYLDWLTKSKLGLQGAKQTNNHGSWYNYQVTTLAYYLGDKALLERILDTVKQSYAFQFDDKGAQPHELKRTRSYFYSCFNLDAMTRIAMISEKVDKSIWHYTSDEGKSLTKAIDFLLPATRGEHWSYKTPGVDASYIAPLLARIAKHEKDEKYSKLLTSILADLSLNQSASHHTRIYTQFALFEPEYFN